MPTPKPKHLPFEFDERNISNQIQTKILLKLMKRSFLEVRVGSRELENEKNKPKPKPKTNTKPKPKPKHLPFEIDERTISNQIQTIFKLMKGSFLEVRAGSRELE